MWGLIIEGGILAADYVYHRWFQDHPTKPNPGQTITVPTSREGAPIPMLYGRTRIKAPILAWWANGNVYSGATFLSTAQYVYGVDMFFNLATGFMFGENKLLSIYEGELRLSEGPPGLSALPGNGGFGARCVIDNSLSGDIGFVGGVAEFLNGNTSQQMVSGITAQNFAAAAMLASGIAPGRIPGYRNLLSVFLSNTGGYPWIFGANPQPGSYSFEAASYPSGGGSGLIGDDVNPIDIVYDLFTSYYGKLGRRPIEDVLDLASLTRAADTLEAEGHGMSRCWDETIDAKSILDEIMAQVDGAYYEDPVTGKLVVKLIRPDFDPNTIKTLTTRNCRTLDTFAAGGRTGVTNKVRVGFTNRSNFYRDDSAVAMNQVNAFKQGEVYSVELSHPGIHTFEVAQQVASRELAARARPLMKCRAVVSREFYRATIGEPIMVSWPDANISRIVFRVASVNRGTMQDESVVLDLIQDYFYQWRRFRPPPPLPIPFPAPPVLG